MCKFSMHRENSVEMRHKASRAVTFLRDQNHPSSANVALFIPSKSNLHDTQANKILLRRFYKLQSKNKTKPLKIANITKGLSLPLFRRACSRRFPPFLRLLGTMAIKDNDPAARKRCPIIWSPTVPSSFAFPGNSCFCLPSPCLLRVSSPSNLPTTDTRYSKSLRHAWEMPHC